MFFQKKIEYICHTPNSKKVDDILNYPKPTDTKQVNSFGLAGFYRPFIENFDHIAFPLTCRHANDVPFIWSDEQQNSFYRLKSLLTEAPVLVFPDFSSPFTLATDASNLGLGTALMHKTNALLHLQPESLTWETLQCN